MLPATQSQALYFTFSEFPQTFFNRCFLMYRMWSSTRQKKLCESKKVARKKSQQIYKSIFKAKRKWRFYILLAYTAQKKNNKKISSVYILKYCKYIFNCITAYFKVLARSLLFHKVKAVLGCEKWTILPVVASY